MNGFRGWGFALLSGALFGAGLVISGMTNPAKVLGFLDVFGAWDASLMLVMASAVGVHAIAYRLVPKLQTPLLAARFALLSERTIDAKLLGGALLFGIGWGLVGYCPGPAVVALATLQPSVLTFMVAVVVGMYLATRLQR